VGGKATAATPGKKRARRAKAAPESGIVLVGQVEGLLPSTDPTLPDFEWWPIARVKPWVHNPRRNKRAVPKVKASLLRWGWGRPLVANVWPGCEGELIVGHTAWLAAQELKLDRVPVRVRRMEPDRAHALALADNKLGEISDWDPEELGRIAASGLISIEDLQLAGFSESELRALHGSASLDEDDVPSLPRVPVTQPGDLWILGEHRLVCGDARNAAHVALALAGAKPKLLDTDPPYGVSFDPKWRREVALRTGICKPPKRTGAVQNDHTAAWREAWLLAPCLVAYVWHGGLKCDTVKADLEAASFEVRSQIIWAKPQMNFTRATYHWQHEPCWYAVKKGAAAGWIGDRKQTTLWEIASKHGVSNPDADDTVHSTQKPLECMARPMRHHDGDVYDPFVGSGTTLIAAQKLGRRCYALDIDPGYCDVAVERWQKLTGQSAQRISAEAA